MPHNWKRCPPNFSSATKIFQCTNCGTILSHTNPQPDTKVGAYMDWANYNPEGLTCEEAIKYKTACALQQILRQSPYNTTHIRERIAEILPSMLTAKEIIASLKNQALKTFKKEQPTPEPNLGSSPIHPPDFLPGNKSPQKPG